MHLGVKKTRLVPFGIILLILSIELFFTFSRIELWPILNFPMFSQKAGNTPLTKLYFQRVLGGESLSIAGSCIRPFNLPGLNNTIILNINMGNFKAVESLAYGVLNMLEKNNAKKECATEGELQLWMSRWADPHPPKLLKRYVR